MKIKIIVLLAVISLSSIGLYSYSEAQIAQSAPHSKRIDDKSFIIAYTPQDKNTIQKDIEDGGCFVLDDNFSSFNVTCEIEIYILKIIDDHESRLRTLEGR